MTGLAARWVRAFHLLFFGCLAIPAIGILPGGDGDLRERGVTLGVAVLMGAWYGFFVVRRPELLERLNPMALHLLVLIALLCILIRREPLYEVTLFGMFALPYLLLPHGWSYLGAGLLMVTAMAAKGMFTQVADDPAVLGSMVGSTALVLIMGVFSRFLITLGEQGKALGVLEERARLAREIHDTLAQGFMGIITQLEAAEQGLGDPVAVRQRISLAKRLARDNLTEARRSVDALRPEALRDVRLDGALATVAERWQAANGIPVTFSVDGRPRPLGTEVETTVLRAAQEGLANIARHAGAERAALTLSYMDDEVTLDVLDDGAGFDPSGPHDGYGLVAMRERASRAGGTVTVESTPKEGTALCLSIPCV
ncbi:sensor histidine kinase [Actinomadura sp. HBU206391]|uniref:sensor histidine kinase n=1 Tax=Actinomadura sp. HBU206391 TaxID=2731692 RepID=UPI00164F9745|nr:sensor histidine kinase [Actinomadura sp. HBU206391]MBC6461660.1 sensor histidine kinase [Actinomadura sp. HBU206391]